MNETKRKRSFTVSEKIKIITEAGVKQPKIQQQCEWIKCAWDQIPTDLVLNF
jgi:hypothetical protein